MGSHAPGRDYTLPNEREIERRFMLDWTERVVQHHLSSLRVLQERVQRFVEAHNDSIAQRYPQFQDRCRGFSSLGSEMFDNCYGILRTRLGQLAVPSPLIAPVVQFLTPSLLVEGVAELRARVPTPGLESLPVQAPPSSETLTQPGALHVEGNANDTDALDGDSSDDDTSDDPGSDSADSTYEPDHETPIVSKLKDQRANKRHVSPNAPISHPSKRRKSTQGPHVDAMMQTDCTIRLDQCEEGEAIFRVAHHPNTFFVLRCQNHDCPERIAKLNPFDKSLAFEHFNKLHPNGKSRGEAEIAMENSLRITGLNRVKTDELKRSAFKCRLRTKPLEDIPGDLVMQPKPPRTVLMTQALTKPRTLSPGNPSVTSLPLVTDQPSRLTMDAYDLPNSGEKSHYKCGNSAQPHREGLPASVTSDQNLNKILATGISAFGDFGGREDGSGEILPGRIIPSIEEPEFNSPDSYATSPTVRTPSVSPI
ncbi:uncharacterized protein JN550_013172 [Neoarthrinium moseri]|uniref:uncharacterized protein n=1 Tax=Neoarthrinium moseri TaxID=1658444 RepID=UPI001FDC5FFD|nr:uncharacterized protein JN550_013172 [Neoarthrinium moseri]KAI1857539.1 hypothetical protein JN550_013172 [Neoarthrinium moseri]